MAAPADDASPDARPAAGGAKLVGAVVQTVRLLRVLAQADEPLGVSAAARAAKVNTSTAFNILRTLAAEGLTTFDEPTKTYRLGGGLFDLAKGLLGQRIEDMIRPELARLASESGCTIALWQVAGDRVVLLDCALSNRPVRLDLAITQRMPLLLGAVGRAVAAKLQIGDDELARGFAGLRWEGAIDAGRYIAEVREARRTGYGLDRETLYRGVVAIAAVITDQFGRPTYGVSAIELADQIDDAKIDRLGGRLAELAATFSIARAPPET